MALRFGQLRGGARERETMALAMPRGGAPGTQKPHLHSFVAAGSWSPKPVWSEGQERFDLLIGADVT